MSGPSSRFRQLVSLNTTPNGRRAAAAPGAAPAWWAVSAATCAAVSRTTNTDSTGARSVPVTELRRRLRALPPGIEVVAYCRGPYCVYADQAVRELARHGFRAWRLIDGYPEWKRAGLPVAAAECG